MAFLWCRPDPEPRNVYLCWSPEHECVLTIEYKWSSYSRILATVSQLVEFIVNSRILKTGLKKEFCWGSRIFCNSTTLVQDLWESLPLGIRFWSPIFFKFNFSLVYRTKTHKFLARPIRGFLAYKFWLSWFSWRFTVSFAKKIIKITFMSR